MKNYNEIDSYYRLYSEWNPELFEWCNRIRYSKGELVILDEVIYESLIDDNIDQLPTINRTWRIYDNQ